MFYHKSKHWNIWEIVLLVVCLPISIVAVPTFLIWRQKKWNITIKIMLTLISTIIIFVAIWMLGG